MIILIQACFGVPCCLIARPHFGKNFTREIPTKTLRFNGQATVPPAPAAKEVVPQPVYRYGGLVQKEGGWVNMKHFFAWSTKMAMVKYF